MQFEKKIKKEINYDLNRANPRIWWKEAKLASKYFCKITLVCLVNIFVMFLFLFLFCRIIRLCLDVYALSPKAFDKTKEFMILPSKRLIR